MNVDVHPVANRFAWFDLTSGLALTGDIPLLNVGRDKATISKYWCNVSWRIHPLPMSRDLFEPGSQNCGDLGHPGDIGFGDHKTLKAGDATSWHIKTLVPAGYRDDVKLYVWGAIRYADSASKNRFFVFARVYDPSHHHFVPVGDPDFEGQDYDDPTAGYGAPDPK